jgi:hypothetical protein
MKNSMICDEVKYIIISQIAQRIISKITGKQIIQLESLLSKSIYS